MMKKLLALALVVFGLAACQTEPQFDVNVGGEQEVMLTVSLSEATRASSALGFDLSTLSTTNSGYTLRYILEVYRFEVGENDSITVLTNHCQHFVKAADATSMVFPVRLAPGYNYRIVAWADIVLDNGKMEDRCYNALNGLANISIVENMWKPMDESRDAFTGVKDITNFSSSSDLDMTLTRPFAKLRVVATDIEDIRAVSLEPTKATVGYYDIMPRSYDAINGIAEGQDRKTHEFSYTDTPVYDDATGEYTLFADYIFVPADGTAQFSLDVYADDDKQMLIKNNAFNTEIFVERNKLTTIKGDVLTIGGDIQVTIENNGAFGGENEYPVLDRTEPANNEIWYTSTDGRVVNPRSNTDFGANIISNTYYGGRGIITFDGDVTKIGDYAFSHSNPFLKSVILPKTVTEIGQSAFQFNTALEEINLPEGITSIGEAAFMSCNSLTSITIPDSVVSIGDLVFAGTIINSFSGKGACDDGKCLVFGDELYAFATRCGATSYAIPDGIKTIKWGAFAYSTIESVDFTNSDVTTIEQYAFAYCENLTSVTIPTSVTSIGECAFTYCDNLENVYILAQIPPAGYDNMFSSCSDNLKIYIPEGSLEAYQTAEGWSNYTDKFVVVCPPSNEIWYTSTDGQVVTPNADAFNVEIESNTYANGFGIIKFNGNVTTIGTKAFWYERTLESIIIPNVVTLIADSAFLNCDSLVSINIPDSVEEIGDMVFYDCDILTTATIGDGVKKIYREAFEACTSLQTVIIGENVEWLSWGIFEYCNALQSIYCKATTPPSVYTTLSFNNSTTIYVPAESYYDYIGANGWSSYANQIVAYDFENNCVTTPIAPPTPPAVPASNEIWYTSTDGNEVALYKTDAFNVNIESHTYDVSKGCWVIKFDGDVTNIGNAFYNCYYLSSVTIPENVEHFEANVFRGCTNLTSVYCKAKEIATMDDSEYGGYLFDENAPGRKIYVPKESVDAYKSADGWKVYADDIVGYDFENNVVVE